MKSHLGFKKCSRCQLKKQGMHHNLSTIISIKTEVKIFVNLMLIAKEAATSTAFLRNHCSLLTMKLIFPFKRMNYSLKSRIWKNGGTDPDDILLLFLNTLALFGIV